MVVFNSGAGAVDSANKERACTIYVRSPDSEQLSAQEIKALLMGKHDEKLRGVKALVYAILNDDQFDKMTMTVITYLVPFQAENHDIKKILLFYWEVSLLVSSLLAYLRLTSPPSRF